MYLVLSSAYQIYIVPEGYLFVIYISLKMHFINQ
jgi:hypothetical protein